MSRLASSTMVVRSTVNRGVLGSSPSWPVKIFLPICLVTDILGNRFRKVLFL